MGAGIGIGMLMVGTLCFLVIAPAIVDKLAYNQRRADHKPENRQKAGGKAY